MGSPVTYSEISPFGGPFSPCSVTAAAPEGQSQSAGTASRWEDESPLLSLPLLGPGSAVWRDGGHTQPRPTWEAA